MAWWRAWARGRDDDVSCRTPSDEDAGLVLTAAQKRLLSHGQSLRHQGACSRADAELAVISRLLAEVDAGLPTLSAPEGVSGTIGGP